MFVLFSFIDAGLRAKSVWFISCIAVGLKRKKEEQTTIQKIMPVL